MESGHKSGCGASGGGGSLCSPCGYQYLSAHRKNCCKPLSAAAVEGSWERDDEKFMLGDGEGGGGGLGGEGNGARAADCGGGLPGSAREVGDVVENEDNEDHSSPNGTGVQDIINKLSEDCLISCDDVASEIAPKAIGIDNDEIQTEVAENAPHLEDRHPSQPAVSSDLCQDASTSVLPPEPEDGARFTSDFSVDEINNSDVTSVASDATAGEISAKTNAVVVCLDDIAVTEIDGMIDAFGKDKTSEDILVKGSEIDSSCQKKSQTKIDEGHSATTMKEDPSVNNFNVVSKEISGEETESKEQSRLIFSNSIEQVYTVKEPVNLLGSKETCTEKHVCADDTNGDDLFQLATGDCHLEAPDTVKTLQQTDLTSVAADLLTTPKQTDIEEGQHCPDADGVGNALGPAVGAEIISAGAAANLTKNVYSSEVTTGDGILKHAGHTSGITFIPSQVDVAELDTYPTSHEIDMVSSRDVVEENRQNENTTAELTSLEINEMRSVDVEEKQQIEDITAYTTSHEANAVCSTGNFGENKPSEEIIAEASSHKISVVQSTSGVEEKEQINEVIANPASNKTDVISSRDFVEEKQQSEVYVGTTQDISVACSVDNVEGKKQNEEVAADPTCEINAVNIPSNVELRKHNEETTREPTACEINMANITSNVKEKKQNEEITTDPTHAVNVICGPGSEDKKPKNGMTEGPSSHRMSRYRIPSGRIQGQHVMLLYQMMHEIGGGCLDFFQEVYKDGSTPRIGVVTTGIPLQPSYYAEQTVLWHSSDYFLPLQNVARKTMIALRTQFGRHLSGTSFGHLPPAFSVEATSHPPPPYPDTSGTIETTGSSARRVTDSLMMIANTMFIEGMSEALDRSEARCRYWQQQLIAVEMERNRLQAALQYFAPPHPETSTVPSTLVSTPPTVPLPATHPPPTATPLCHR